MLEQKKRRVISAIISGGIMLIVILVVILMYQMVSIFSSKKRIKELDLEIERLTNQINYNQTEIESWSTRIKIEQRARELGYYNPNEN